MFKAICDDFLEGFINSLKVHYINKYIRIDPKFAKIIGNLFKNNFTLHILPLILIWCIQPLFTADSFIYQNLFIIGLVTIINYILKLFSAVYHLIHYTDLVNIISIHASKATNSFTVIETVTLAITMSIYQIVIYITTGLINFIFHDRIYIVSVILNFFILTIYHSFYCHNNLWQYKKIEMFHRIDIHEKLWPYYFGYGMVATIIYFYTANMYILCIYNLYLALLLILPFVLPTKLPPSGVITYPKINLIIFSYLTGWICAVAKYIVQYCTR